MPKTEKSHKRKRVKEESSSSSSSSSDNDSSSSGGDEYYILENPNDKVGLILNPDLGESSFVPPDEKPKEKHKRKK